VARSQLRVLDVGCVTGNIALKFFVAGDSVDGVDLFLEMLVEFWHKQPENTRLHFCIYIETDADTFLASANNYDVICFSSVLHHLPDYRATFFRYAELLVSGCVIYVTHEPLPKVERTQPAPIQNMLIRIMEIHDASEFSAANLYLVRCACGYRNFS